MRAQRALSRQGSPGSPGGARRCVHDERGRGARASGVDRHDGGGGREILGGGQGGDATALDKAHCSSRHWD